MSLMRGDLATNALQDDHGMRPAVIIRRIDSMVWARWLSASHTSFDQCAAPPPDCQTIPQERALRSIADHAGQSDDGEDR